MTVDPDAGIEVSCIRVEVRNVKSVVAVPSTLTFMWLVEMYGKVISNWLVAPSRPVWAIRAYAIRYSVIRCPTCLKI